MRFWQEAPKGVQQGKLGIWALGVESAQWGRKWWFSSHWKLRIQEPGVRLFDVCTGAQGNRVAGGTEGTEWHLSQVLVPGFSWIVMLSFAWSVSEFLSNHQQRLAMGTYLLILLQIWKTLIGGVRKAAESRGRVPVSIMRMVSLVVGLLECVCGLKEWDSYHRMSKGLWWKYTIEKN